MLRIELVESGDILAQLPCVLQPSFSINRQCTAVGIIPEVAAPLIEALRAAGLSDWCNYDRPSNQSQDGKVPAV